MEPDPKTHELTLTGLHPGVTVEDVVEKTGWSDLKIASELTTTEDPTQQELDALRELIAR